MCKMIVLAYYVFYAIINIIEAIHIAIGSISN